ILSAKRQRRRRRGGLNSGQRTQAREQFFKKNSSALGIRIAHSWKAELRGNQLSRLEAGRNVAEMIKTDIEKRSTDQKDQRQREFGNHQTGPQARSSNAAQASTSFLIQGNRDALLRGHQCRNDTKERARQRRYSQRRKQHANIETGIMDSGKP